MIKFPDVGPHWRRLKEVMERRRGQPATQQPLDANPIPASLVASAKAASWIAYFCLVYFLWLYTLDIAKDRAADLHLTKAGLWVAGGDGLEFWFPYIIGFAVISIGIPYVAKIAIPTFMSLTWNGNAWPKAWALFIAVSVSLVVFAGTFTIQGDAILEKGRESSVAVAQVEQSKAVLQAQIAAKEAELKSMMENRNAYLAQAASVGEKEWQRSYVQATSANDPQRDRIVRALGAARAADAVRSDLRRLREISATQTTIAAVAEHPAATAGTSWVAASLDYIQGIRAILLSLVMDIVALLMPWIALRLEQARARGVGRSYDGAIAIEDHSEEARLPVEPYTQPSEKRKRVWDDDAQAWMYKREAHYARVPTQKAKRKVPGKNGKLVPDETLYEPPARKITLNADPVEMETVKVEEPDDGGRAFNIRENDSDRIGANSRDAADDVRANDDGNSADQAPAPVLADAASVVSVEAAPLDREQYSEPASDEARDDSDSLQIAPHTVILDDDRFDEMVAKGQIDEEGTPLAQDGAEVIEQPRDARAEEFADKFGLPQPKANGALEKMQ